MRNALVSIAVVRLTAIAPLLLVWFSLFGTGHAAGGERYVGRFRIGGEFICVVAEGDLEPRSIGTYGVRLYKNLEVGAFVTGVIRRRDGFVRKAFAGGVDARGRQMIVVEIETAGSGRYVTRDVFTFDGVSLTLSESGTRR